MIAQPKRESKPKPPPKEKPDPVPEVDTGEARRKAKEEEEARIAAAHAEERRKYNMARFGHADGYQAFRNGYYRGRAHPPATKLAAAKLAAEANSASASEAAKAGADAADVSAAGTLTVHLKRGVGLKQGSWGDKSDPYCKVSGGGRCVEVNRLETAVR